MSDRPPTDPAVAAARGPEVRRPEAGAAVAADGSAGGEGAAGPAAFAAEPSRRALAPLVAVVLLLQLVAVAGLVAGSRTLYLRDVLTTHLPMKLAQAAAWERRELPLLDPARGGGQPSLGNPNGVPLYADNLLYLAAPDAWADWEGRPPSYRKVVTHWVTGAKRPETRAKRLAILIESCAKGEKIPGYDIGRKKNER